MRSWHRIGGWLCGLGLGLSASPALWACATCFGKSDSRLAVGMNWGIAVLLVVVLSVLAGIASFFVFLSRRGAEVEAAALRANPSPEHTPESKS
ncbi:MAG: hypothetical protein FJ404_06300 [Verrucomicrobia bacterium]|nr:hypothetical protein [Verrucomicrobiota bacterium]